MVVVWILLGLYLIMKFTAMWRIEPPSVDDDNPYLNASKVDTLPEDMRKWIKPVARGQAKGSFYDRVWKRLLDVGLSFCALVLLSPLFGILALAIFIDDPGPVFFTQNRVGKGKHYFALHKFRSMKMSTPHDMPTHMLEHPDQYITRMGRFLRKSSLDELPQIWEIFRGKMSIIGPRPALWNQADLVYEREKYGANDILPGLTGWAQINGRDELEIPIKAKFDGEYVKKESFAFDVKCFFGTIFSVLRSDGVVEGGTGEIHRHEQSESHNEKVQEIVCQNREE